MQPNTDSTVRDRSRRLRAAVDRLESEPETDADGTTARAAAERDAASERRSAETGGVRTESGPESTTTANGIETLADRCAACGTTIGPREYRISRVVEQGPDAPTLESHYCSEACLSEDGSDPESSSRSESQSESESESKARANSSSDRSEPRDWSYCR